MPTLETAQIAKLLRELGLRMELRGGNPYQARAYRRAAENLVLTGTPVEQLIAEGRLREIPGVGRALEGLITKLHQTGKHEGLETLRKAFPAGVLDMLAIPGLKAERVRKLHDTLGIRSLQELEDAARGGQLSSVKGFGPAFQARVLQGIQMSRASPGRHMHRAAVALSYAREQLINTHPAWESVTAAGELRRGCELVRTLSFVAVDSSHRGQPRMMTFGEELTVYVTSRDGFGITLLLATGSERHLAALKSLAHQKHWTLDAAGLCDDRRVIASRTEADIYSSLGLAFIAPELRENGEEVRWALEGRLPDLVVKSDLHGVLHAHTDQSDGADTLEAMAEAARQRGYAYLGLTDHSQSAHYAGGLKVEEVRTQHRAIDALNGRYGSGFHVFKGIESDILSNGSLDYSEEVLSSFDLIIASVHSHFRMNRDEQTARIIRAVANPHTVVLGHVTGRLLKKRPGYEVDLERVLAACAQYGVAVEINANPWRLDLDWRWCLRALELGCMVSINPDAHSTQEFDHVDWGVTMARKGAVPKERVLNTCTYAQFAAHLRTRRQRR